MNSVLTPVMVQAKDIIEICLSYYSDGTYMSFLKPLEPPFGISKILLRSILKCFGDYQIISQSEYINPDIEDEYGNLACYMVYHTNLPLQSFIEVAGNVFIDDLNNIKDELTDNEEVSDD